MCSTCDNVKHMSRMIQIRNVPDELHREAKARAARAGMTLSDYLLREIERALSLPTVDELLARLEKMPSPDITESPADALLAVRSERDAR